MLGENVGAEVFLTRWSVVSIVLELNGLGERYWPSLSALRMVTNINHSIALKNLPSSWSSYYDNFELGVTSISWSGFSLLRAPWCVLHRCMIYLCFYLMWDSGMQLYVWLWKEGLSCPKQQKKTALGLNFQLERHQWPEVEHLVQAHHTWADLRIQSLAEKIYNITRVGKRCKSAILNKLCINWIQSLRAWHQV